MSSPNARSRWWVGAACTVLLLAASWGAAPVESEAPSRGAGVRWTVAESAGPGTTPPGMTPPDRQAPVPVPEAVGDAPGGWRPKRPVLCASAFLASGIAAALLSTSPVGGGVALIAMLPLLVEACA